MIPEEIFTQLPLEGDSIDTLFVNREQDLNFVLSWILPATKKVIGVFGSRGSGKTTFLNAIERYYERTTRQEFAISHLDAEEVVNKGGIMECLHDDISKIKIIMIDNGADLSDEDALKMYKHIYNVVVKHKVNVIFTDKPKRGNRVVNKRDWLCNFETNMNLDIDGIKRVLKERLEKGGVGELFTDEAMEILSLRAGWNLRNLFKYAEGAYHHTKKEKGITTDEVREIIKIIDERKIRGMNELPKIMLLVLIEHPWVNVKEFTMHMKKELNRDTLNMREVYEALDVLASGGYLIHRKVGREKRLATIYEKIGIRIDIEPPQKKRDFELGIGL